MSITIFSQPFKFDLFCKHSGKLILTYKCYLNEIRKILEEHGLEFIEMNKTGSDSWKVIVDPDDRWKLEY